MIEPRNPFELAIEPTKLQDDILALLEDAGISPSWCDEIMKLVENAEIAKCEVEYERHQERLMDRHRHGNCRPSVSMSGMLSGSNC